MGYLDNSSVTIDAILTIKGRELLSKGGNNFNITQFALGDDEIDYTLWNTDHPLGTAYYGTIIENMPILEAVPDETQALRSKLVTLKKATQKIPVVSAGGATTFNLINAQQQTIKPSTINIPGANSQKGYTCIVSDNTILGLSIIQTVPGMSTQVSDVYDTMNTDAHSISAVGFQFQIFAKGSVDEDKKATVTIIGNETGGSVTIQVIVKKITAKG